MNDELVLGPELLWCTTCRDTVVHSPHVAIDATLSITDYRCIHGHKRDARVVSSRKNVGINDRPDMHKGRYISRRGIRVRGEGL